MLISIITTTINSPSFLNYYFKNLKDNNIDKNSIKFIIVGDNKTPNDKWFNCDFDYSTEYWDIETQNIYLNKLTNNKDMLTKLFPENNMLRRNFGYLRAIELGSDIVITVDDDNLPIDCNYVKSHIDALNNKQVYSVRSSNKIINHCEILKMNHSGIYGRGYPTDYMFNLNTVISEGLNNKEVMLNMGLWTNKPDVDATYNVIFNDLNSEKILLTNNFSICKDNYFSVNTQNTAIKGKASHIFHNEYMNIVNDYPLHRYDDIWSGLFTLKVIHANNDTASFGNPIVEHRRNTHNYSKDLQTEYMGYIINNRVWNKVMNMDISSGDYIQSYLDIAKELSKTSEFEQSINKYFHTLSDTMIFWCKLVDKVL